MTLLLILLALGLAGQAPGARQPPRPPDPQQALCGLLWQARTPERARDDFLKAAEELLAQGRPAAAAKTLDEGLAQLWGRLQEAFFEDAIGWRPGRRALDEDLLATGPAAIRGDLLTLRPWALTRSQRVYCAAGREADARRLALAALRDWGGREHLVNRLLLALRFGRLAEARALLPAPGGGHREEAAAALLACLEGQRSDALAAALYRASRLVKDAATRQGLEKLEDQCRP